MIVSEAPGKVILFGEHSVVYGYPALAAAVSLKTRVELKEINQEVSTLESIPLNLTWRMNKGSPPLLKPLERVIYLIEKEADRSLRQNLYIKIRSDIKPGSGLGSSASVAVALTGALFKYLDWDIDLELINKIAYEAEKVAHGTPSGIDNTIATYGGLVKFIKTKDYPIIEKISLDESFPLVLVDTGLGRSTKVAVSKVRGLLDKYDHFVKKIFETIGGIAEKIWDLFTSKNLNLEIIGELMNLNHGLLNAIGVSNARIEEIINFARELGALGAKITGAGLGGYVLILPPEDNLNLIVDELKKKFGAVYLTSISNTGLNVYIQGKV